MEDKTLLINKFLSGEISDIELDSLKTWLSEDNAHRRIFDEENEIWQESGHKTRQEYFLPEIGWQEISTHLGIGKSKVNPVVVLKKNYYRSLLAAASIAFIAAIGGLVLWQSEKTSEKTISITSTTIQTEEGEKAHIMMADSSIIVLNSATTVEYSNDFNLRERNVKLSGEAFFDVHTDSSKPFIVSLDNMSVSATGTRFNILAYKNEDRIETTLEEGKIKVAIAGGEIIDVKAGQQVIYFTKTNKVFVKDVSTETYTSWTENRLRLIDTPMEEAFRRIARRYNVVFEIRSNDLLDMNYTATFIDESIEDVMQMLKAVSPIKYKIINRTLISDKNYLKPKIVVEKR